MPQYYSNDNTEIRQQFADNLRGLLHERGINQSELARKINCSRNMVSEYLKGISLPSPVRLKRLAEFFKVEPVDLLPTTGTGKGVPSMAMTVGSDNMAFLQINQKLPLAIASQIMQIIHDWKESEEKGKKK